MAKKVDRIIVDTNLWISFLIKNDFKKLDDHIKKGKSRIIFSLELVDEFLTVADRPKFRKYFNKRDIELLIEVFDTYGVVVTVTSHVRICRDIKDNFLLALCQDSKADYLITGDHDLLELVEFEGTRIIKMSEFLKGK